ncbi:hypothetical protein BWK58_14405 [Flavobacterium columnare]|nr:hypothetical protein BWK58_14405 [Flavobacterium columnare]
MKTTHTIPTQSLLNNNVNYQYIDSYQETFTSTKTITAEDLGKAFFATGPEWIGALMSFRDKIVSALGLKTSSKVSNREDYLNNLKWEAGDQIGIFKVYDKSANELIIGEDDKHLDFRVSLLLQPTENSYQKTLSITTVVTIHNTLGKLYFLPVKPFHQFIVPRMLRGMIKGLAA